MFFLYILIIEASIQTLAYGVLGEFLAGLYFDAVFSPLFILVRRDYHFSDITGQVFKLDTLFWNGRLPASECTYSGHDLSSAYSYGAQGCCGDRYLSFYIHLEGNLSSYYQVTVEVYTVPIPAKKANLIVK